ncbi:MAG: hypothetical protein AB7F89_00445 [Pirellulaceae bacterium]
MPTLLEHLTVVNSTLRTLLAVALCGGAGWIGWYGYSAYHAQSSAAAKTATELADARRELADQTALLAQRDAAIRGLRDEVAVQRQQIDRLDTALRLLKVDRRVARLTVVDQRTDGETGELFTQVEFQELSDEGVGVDAARQFRIAGDVVYVDAWVVKFDDKYIEEAALDRATSLVLFRRIFGERQKPSEGFPLDEAGMRPTVYGRGGNLTELEKKIWGDFWSVANDEQRQAELGIRAAHGEAPSLKVQKGKSYRLELRSSGGLTLTPEADVPRPPKPAA